MCGQDEEGIWFTDEAYGKHRRMMEEWVMSYYLDYHIVRLPALFGIGLKKNALYDLLTGNKTCAINPLDSFQWYYLDDLYEDLNSIVSDGWREVNLFSEPVTMQDVLSEFFDVQDVSVREGKPILYNFITQYTESGYWNTKFEILESMHKFISLWRKLEHNRDKLVISNLCWREDSMGLRLLSRYGIQNVELAISKYNNDLDHIKKIFKSFSIYSMQALFYGTTYNIFSDNENFKSHFTFMINSAKTLGVKRLVFGSPRNRLLPDGMSVSEADNIFISTFQEISKLLSDDMCVCIEPNAVQYGCNYLTTIKEVINILNKIDRSNIGLNLDTGNAKMMDESYDYQSIDSYVRHVQLSAPFLTTVSNILLDDAISSKYIGKVSLEAKELSQNELEESVKSLILSF
jgi:hypothetical protein